MSHSGQRETLDVMFSAAYEELRRLAASVRRDDPGATLSPTALVNEAWLKLASTPGCRPTSPPPLQADRGPRHAPGAVEAPAAARRTSAAEARRDDVR